MTRTNSLEDRLCLVTGGGTGIGRAIAESLSASGARVVITGRRREPLEDVAARIGSLIIPRQHDIGELESIPSFIESIENDLGPIDTLVNNAGRHQKKPSLEVTDADLEDVLSINTKAVFAMTREVAKRMAPRSRGDIQIISSMAALFGIPYVASYTMSKAAVTGLVHELAVEWGSYGIRVNAIAPGFIETEMSKKALDSDPERKSKVLNRTPLGRLGTTAEIGRVSAFLASDAASFITGVTLPVDGGAAVGF